MQELFSPSLPLRNHLQCNMASIILDDLRTISIDKRVYCVGFCYACGTYSDARDADCCSGVINSTGKHWIEIVEHGLSSFSSQVYDWILTIEDERRLVWSYHMTFMKILYLLNRYVVFVGTFGLAYGTFTLLFIPQTYLSYVLQ